MLYTTRTLKFDDFLDGAKVALLTGHSWADNEEIQCEVEYSVTPKRKATFYDPPEGGFEEAIYLYRKSDNETVDLTQELTQAAYEQAAEGFEDEAFTDDRDGYDDEGEFFWCDENGDKQPF